MAVVQYLLKSGSGFVFQILLADLLALFITVYVTITTVYPFVKRLIELKKIADKVGEPKDHWFWGDAKKYGFTHQGLENMVRRCDDFPAMSTVYLGLTPIFYMCHPDVNKTLFTCSSTKSWAYKKVVSGILREGLIISEGNVWKRHRRMLTAIFHFDILKEHCQVFSKNYEILSKAFDEIAETETAGDVTSGISECAYANMMQCVMSQSAVDKDGHTSIFVPIVKEINGLVLKRLQNPFHWVESVYNLSKRGKRFNELKNIIFSESNKIIKERKELLNSMTCSSDASRTNVITDQNGKTFIFKKRKGKIMDFLDILIQAKDDNGVGLKEEEIADEVINFFLAGMETVATTMTWMSYLFAKHQDCQDRCREEILTVLGDKENIEMSDLNKLPYLNQCVKEALRLYPPVHVVARSLEEDTTFSHRFNNYEKVVIKKGTNVAVSTYATHRNPNIWANPEAFDPERFNEENITKIPPYAYIPFAAGSRNCIGQHFAMHEVKVTITKLIRQYQLLWDPKHPEPIKVVGITIFPKGGLPLIVKRIKK